MAHYDVRDLLGHFVRPKRMRERMCPHRCCRGKRPHPDRFPLMLPRDVLRSSSEAELMRHLGKGSVGRDDKAVSQVVSELERRDRIQRNARARRDRAKHARRSREQAYRDYLEAEWVSAEAATQGNMVNKRGRAKDIDPRSLWTGNDRTRAAYASEELRHYWDSHPIVSREEFTGGEAGQRRGARRRQESRLYGVY